MQQVLCVFGVCGVGFAGVHELLLKRTAGHARLRFALDHHVNLRPVKLFPGVETPLSGKGPADIDFIVVRENTEDLYCGAGGFSSAVGEMGEHSGAIVWLEKCPLKYAGLSYTEIWISEAQERMVAAVPKAITLPLPETSHEKGEAAGWSRSISASRPG